MKKIGILWCILFCLCMCAGCDIENELTKEEAFKDIERVSDSRQIQINFAYKDKESNERMHDFDTYMLGLEMTSSWGTQMIPGVIISPDNGNLGIYIQAEGNIWEIRDLYHQDHIPIWGAEDLEERKLNEKDSELKEIYQNAEWELEPLRSEFNFWIEDYTDISVDEQLSGDKKTELFNVVDTVTGTKFTISLVEVVVLVETVPEPEIMF